MERTLVILKPDAVRRKLIGEIISRFEKKNLTIDQMKIINIDRELALEHYAHVKGYSFFEDMINYITSGPVVVMIISGENAVTAVRNLVGKTNCLESPPGTIRGDYGFHRFENLIHASDSVESAELEIKRFFSS
ncbi:nucleoside-diphosphate kinase [Acetivibrio clariflavus]|uniref:Nucleoside diphosphate kinase n=1 Tax=Acetivibrio clariflavus (strain DSM 19732 / NBRC 101661 / EBR45) TaxID=720554 RepID=G8LU64_ACECE|nr:nucleoside-diphosphate kinase [Acetivibrio clariflavus]AEV68452.1 nucleoside diphosphate kinase [Acetivibrio clariflavus DSM 19732]